MPYHIPPPTAPIEKAPPKSLRITHGLDTNGLSTTSSEGSYIATKGLACDQHVPWSGIQKDIKEGDDSRRQNTFLLSRPTPHVHSWSGDPTVYIKSLTDIGILLPPMWTASRIKQTVYVDVPEPPYSLSIFPSLKGDTSRVPTRKRTVSEHHSPPLPKKHKVATSKPLVFSQPVTQSTSNACPEKSKGYIHCHQCSQKRDMAGAS